MIHVEFTVSRQHLVVLAGMLLAGVLLAPGVSWAAQRFVDVPATNVFASDIEWLADAGITKGCNPPSNTEYCPDRYVTRGQMAAFMHRLSGGDNSTLDGRLDAIEGLLAGVTRSDDATTLVFSGMNVQIDNGQAYSLSSANGLGNLIIGPNYHAGPTTGSHYLVIGERNSYTGVFGIVATNSGRASGHDSYIIGGAENKADGAYAVVIGGQSNTASGQLSVAIGGYSNNTQSHYATTTGGQNNTAGAEGATTSGGRGNVANGLYSSVSGGRANYATGDYSSVSGGRVNYATGEYSSVSGGSNNAAMGAHSSILGAQSLQLWLDHETYPTGP